MPTKGRPVILMVDDDVDTREMYQWCLEARGFDVLSAGTASEGFRLAQQQRPDAIVTDFTLPGEDGFVLASRLRAADDVLAEIPAVLVSGRAFVGNSGETAMRLFDHVLLKPVLPDQLIETLVPLMLDRTAARLDRQLRAVCSRLEGVPRTSDVSRVLRAVDEVTRGGEAPAALLADSTAQYIDANDAACTLTGRSRAELLSMHVWDLTPQEAIAERQAAWARFVESGAQSGAYVLRDASGAEIEARFAASAHVLPGCHLALLQSVPPALTRDARS
jgi:CheY-like chemotaxis protein